MNEQELRSLVERMVLELAGQPNAAAPAKATPVTAAAAPAAVWTTSQRPICGGNIWSKTPETVRPSWI